MNKWKRIRPYIAFCAIALAVGGASSFATRAGMADFDLLTKPPAAPPDWLFPIVWTILYLLMGIAMGLVWRSSTGRARKEATALWSIQLAVNGLWPVLFFLLGAHGPAFFWLVGKAGQRHLVHDVVDLFLIQRQEFLQSCLGFFHQAVDHFVHGVLHGLHSGGRGGFGGRLFLCHQFVLPKFIDMV